MTRITLIDPTSATGDVADTLAQVKSAFGVVPNMFKAVANSPAALSSMWSAFGALGHGRLGAKLGEQIAVAIADRNACHYCLAAHTGLGRRAGATAEEMAEAQVGRSRTRARQPLWPSRFMSLSTARTSTRPMSMAIAMLASTTGKLSRSSHTWPSTCSPTT